MMVNTNRIVDAMVRKAIEEGKFDNLKGKGQPLDLSSNAFADPEWALAFDMLQKEGFALPWMEKRKEIEATLEGARTVLARSAAWRKDKLAEGISKPRWIEDEWARAKEIFIETVTQINKQIADLNLEVPSDIFMRKKVNVERELEIANLA